MSNPTCTGCNNSINRCTCSAFGGYGSGAGMSSPTHLLKCRHCIGNNCTEYYMPCDIIKRMPDGRLKIRVYGDRQFHDKTNITKIRYVRAGRVTPAHPG